MAHFARLDDNNIVTMVTVVSNDDMVDENGNEVETLGVAVCEQVVGAGPWVQTSYNSNFRKKYAGVGDAYDADADVFYDPVSPFPSWLLDENYNWQPPIPMPAQNEGTYWVWDEDSVGWVEVPVEEPEP